MDQEVGIVDNGNRILVAFIATEDQL